MGYVWPMAVSDQKLGQIVQILKAEFKPLKIYLFGSRAKGTSRADSDYDLVLVGAKSNLNKFERMQRASDLLYPLGVTADVFFYSEAEFESWKDEFSSIPELAMREGREIELG